MAETDIAHLPRKMPASVPIGAAMTPNEMRALKELTGRPLGELLGGDPDDMDTVEVHEERV